MFLGRRNSAQDGNGSAQVKMGRVSAETGTRKEGTHMAFDMAKEGGQLGAENTGGETKRKQLSESKFLHHKFDSCTQPEIQEAGQKE